MNEAASISPFPSKPYRLLSGRLVCVLLLMVCVGMFALANYGQATQWAFGDCDVIYFPSEYRPNCMLWRDAITNMGLTPAVFAVYFVILRVAAALPFVFLSGVLMRRRIGETLRATGGVTRAVNAIENSLRYRRVQMS